MIVDINGILGITVFQAYLTIVKSAVIDNIVIKFFFLEGITFSIVSS